MVAGCVTETHGVPRHTPILVVKTVEYVVFLVPHFGIMGFNRMGTRTWLLSTVCIHIPDRDNPLLGRMTVGVTNEAWCRVVALLVGLRWRNVRC